MANITPKNLEDVLNKYTEPSQSSPDRMEQVGMRLPASMLRDIEQAANHFGAQRSDLIRDVFSVGYHNLSPIWTDLVPEEQAFFEGFADGGDSK